MTTLDRMAEQAQRIAVRSVAPENTNHTIDKREIYPLIVQLVNNRLNIYQMDQDVIGDVSIPACIIATYSIPVVEISGRYHAEIPVIPIRLPRDMGVFRVTPPSGGLDFIPVMPSMVSVLGALDEMNLEGNIGYRVEGNKIRFLKNPTVSSVDVQLLVYPLDLNDPNAYVPVYADLEAEIVMEAARMIIAAGQSIDRQMERDIPPVQSTPAQPTEI